MENAVEALKIGFAVFVFVMALSLIMNLFTQARITADAVLHSSDITDTIEIDDYNSIRVSNTNDNGYRIVGLETVIPTLYRYYKENYTVIFRTASGYMELYESDTDLWNPGGTPGAKGYKNRYYSADGDSRICSFDQNEEQTRHEPWTANQEYNKQFLDTFLAGGKFYYPSYTEAEAESAHAYYDFGDGFIKKYKGTKFLETLGEYSYGVNTDSLSDQNSSLLQNRKKRVIIYTEL